MFNHEELRKTWKPDDYWQYNNKDGDGWRRSALGCEPAWDIGTDYRIHPHNELMKAFDAGKKIQFLNYTNNQWETTKNPLWNENIQLRIKPKKSKTPKVGDLVMVWNDDIRDVSCYYLEDIEHRKNSLYIANGKWKNCLTPKQWVKQLAKQEQERLNQLTNSIK